MLIIERSRPVIGRAADFRRECHRTLGDAFGPGARLHIEPETRRRALARFLCKLRMRVLACAWRAAAWLTEDDHDSDARFFRSLDVGVACACAVFVVVVGLWNLWGALA